MPPKKVSVTLTYTSPGARPPIFLAGSFSKPAWHPQEMDFITDENGEYLFHKEVQVDEGGEFQYKFRIGLGEWWALNEQATTVTDEIGNRNNLLCIPATEEINDKYLSARPASTPALSETLVPEVVLEKVDGEPRHGDDFGPDATAGQKKAHNMRAHDAEPDYVIIRSGTLMPVYADTAAEAAHSAAILDSEPSPIRVSDEEAGRIGERGTARTPIPQVSLTAAEVAGIAMILDQGEEDDVRLNALHFHSPYDMPSDSTTSWHEQAPLFAHECLGPNDNDGVEVESPITYNSPISPTKSGQAEEITDFNDPLLEPFPKDRISILTHIRSAGSRMREDETSVNGVPWSPVTGLKSQPLSLDTPGSTRPHAQPPSALGVIAEEHHESESSFGLPAPIKKMESQGEVRGTEELNVIPEAEELIEEPSEVLEHLKWIEESTVDSSRRATVNPSEAEEDKPSKNPVTAEGQAIIGSAHNQTNELPKTRASIEVEPMETRESRSVEGPSKAQGQNATDDTSEQITVLMEAKESMKLEAINEAKILEIETTKMEGINCAGLPKESQEPHVDLNDISAAERVQHKVVLKEPKELIENTEQHKASNEVGGYHMSKQKQQAKETPQSEESKDLLDSKKSKDAKKPRQVDGSMNIAEHQQDEDAQIYTVNDISMGGATVEYPPSETTFDVRGVEQVSDSQELTPEHHVGRSEAHRSEIALENTEAERAISPEVDMPISQIQADNTVPPPHIKSATSGASYLDEIDDTKANSTETAKSTSINTLSHNSHDPPKLKLRGTTPNLERAPTPSSICSPMKASESHNVFQKIWNTIWVDWIGGVTAHFCGNERGPLLTISAVIILAPLLAMYLYQLNALEAQKR